MAAEWRPVVGFEGFYEVSSVGEVRRMRFTNATADRPCRPRMLRPWRGRKGYLRVSLFANGKSCKPHVHALMLLAFVGPRPEGNEAAHENGVRDDNRLENLSWKTRKENHADMHRHGTAQIGERNSYAKLRWVDVERIRELRAAGMRLRVIGAMFGIANSTVSDIAYGRRWKLKPDADQQFALAALDARKAGE